MSKLQESRESGSVRYRIRPDSVSVLATLLTLFVNVGAAYPQALASVSNFTLQATVALAMRENADLKSLRAKYEAMLERPAQAGALPDPMFTYSGMDMASGGVWPDTSEKRYMIQQEFPWFGKRALREGVAEKDAEIMQRELESMTREVVLMVKENYFDLYAVQRVMELTESEQEVLRRIEKVAGSMYATGDRAQADVLKGQTERTMLKQKLLELGSRETTLKAKLNTLLNRSVADPLTVAAPDLETGLRTNSDFLISVALTNRSEILAARALTEKNELEKDLMGKESMPDYKLGLEYRSIGTGDDMVMFSVSVNLPLWRSKYAAGVREARNMRSSSEAAREAAERQSEFDVQDAVAKLQAAKKTLELYRNELIPQADARFSASEAGYRSGKVDFMDLLESERFLLGAKMMAVMTEGTIGMQAARLERVTGVKGTQNEK